MQIEIDRDSSVPIYIQITNKIKELILNGYLPHGYKLPPERKLAEELGVNRSTVLNAYRDLKAVGLIESRVGQGTIVNTLQTQSTSEFKRPDAFKWKQFLSENMSRVREAVSIDIMEMASRTDIISFAAGVANTQLDPVDKMIEVQEELIRKHGANILKVTPTEGIYPLRESVMSIMGERGITSSLDEVMILSGSQQGIELIARALINPGDVVVVEEPTFFCALQVFKAMGARIVGVPVDGNGMRTDILEAILKRYKPVLIYTVPTFQNPSGTVMSIERRRELLNLAYKYQIPVIEDDPYYELQYEGDTVPTIKSMDSYGYVIYLSSFSKIMFQGLRVGWMIASPSLIQQMIMLKQMADLHSSSLPQWILDSFYRKGLIKKHIDLLRKNYAAKRDIMMNALINKPIRGMEWTVPKGGLFLWCRLPDEINESVLMLKAAVAKIAFLPGHICYPDNKGEKAIRLNFTLASDELIIEGVRRLLQVIEETLRESRKIRSEEKIEIKPVI